ncbi:hypothetical protein Cch01nite_18080 [Cellulomonas chitinilytica]|uniref:DUF1269 domain-containing protein n=1 Tax=Cellulomonas chitinilytica TaxID=398759 RepID=A0A919U2G3_9CELL|nr:DUF1269 domain-containing protein [Cellulomonas chitinilytica]GIG21084.1 hypothetical protein Cch01nite_18080 [Cellulomonas chitinilytica]
MSDDVIIEAAAVSDGAYTLLIADFADTEVAWEAYEAIKEAEDGSTVKVEGALVVKREVGGKVEVLTATDHSTRRGLTWGVVGGVALGLIFPPSILGSAVALGAVGAATGKGLEIRNRKGLEDDLKDAVAPGHSGILVLVSDPAVVELRKALDKAEGIVEKAVDKAEAAELKAAADEVAATES